MIANLVSVLLGVQLLTSVAFCCRAVVTVEARAAAAAVASAAVDTATVIIFRFDLPGSVIRLACFCAPLQP